MALRADDIETLTFKKALVVDDHPLFCDALALTLKLVSDIEDVTTTDRLENALDIITHSSKPDVIILDLNLPDVTGLDGLIRLKSVAPKVPVVVVSSMADNRMISHSLRAGASGFVPKHSQRDVFRDAFSHLSEGRVFTPDGYVEVTNNEDPSTGPEDALARLSSLTAQQARILQLICEGKLNKQIAYDLSIAETTVKAHVTAIMRKLGVQSRTQAVLIAQEARFAKVLPTVN
ncbi:response regulator transcription factor [Parasulfitobacter algicola]|uniref:Response regulator transcription factor n=1 Tax=Parasulfitobacter algicola TaxID=2614809 RepID=A0ABX2ILQ1_9RHOB|nr:response regulator transcription factor [Sulfitobacter algicola]NSX53315.1 response regulator transcription factor [Sulfitobacter algicola]